VTDATATPTGIHKLLARMPQWFVDHAQQSEERACRQRELEAARFELEFLCAIEVKESSWDEWQDTVADFSAR